MSSVSGPFNKPLEQRGKSGKLIVKTQDLSPNNFILEIFGNLNAAQTLFTLPNLEIIMDKTYDDKMPLVGVLSQFDEDFNQIEPSKRTATLLKSVRDKTASESLRALFKPDGIRTLIAGDIYDPVELLNTLACMIDYSWVCHACCCLHSTSVYTSTAICVSRQSLSTAISPSFWSKPKKAPKKEPLQVPEITQELHLKSWSKGWEHMNGPLVISNFDAWKEKFPHLKARLGTSGYTISWVALHVVAVRLRENINGQATPVFEIIDTSLQPTKTTSSP